MLEKIKNCEDMYSHILHILLCKGFDQMPMEQCLVEAVPRRTKSCLLNNPLVDKVVRRNGSTREGRAVDDNHPGIHHNVERMPYVAILNPTPLFWIRT